MNCSISDATDSKNCGRFKTRCIRGSKLAATSIAAMCVALLTSVPAGAHETGVPHAHPHVAGGYSELVISAVFLAITASILFRFILQRSTRQSAILDKKS